MLDRNKILDLIQKYGTKEEQDNFYDNMDGWTDEELEKQLKAYNIPFNVEDVTTKSKLESIPKGISDSQLERYAEVNELDNETISEYKKQRDEKEVEDAETDYKSERQQRQKDVDNFGAGLSKWSRNSNVADELNAYDVKAMLKKYTDGGMSKEDALKRVRQDIKDINEREATVTEKALKPIGWATQAVAPQMYIDHYVDTGDYNSPGAWARSIGGTALNLAELNPLNPVGKAKLAVKAARIGLKPSVEAVRTNVMANDDRTMGQKVIDTGKDFLIDAGINALTEGNPKEIWDWSKGVIGFGGASEKASKSFFDEALESAETLHNNKIKDQTEERLLKKLGLKREPDIKPSGEGVKSNEEAFKDLVHKAGGVPNASQALYEYAHKAKPEEVKTMIDELKAIGKDTEANLLELYYRTDLKPTFAEDFGLTLGRGNLTDEKHLNAVMDFKAKQQARKIIDDRLKEQGKTVEDVTSNPFTRLFNEGEKFDIVKLNSKYGDNTLIDLKKPWNWREPVKYEKIGKAINYSRPVVRAIADANNDKNADERDVKLIRMWQAGFVPPEGTDLYGTYLKWKNNRKK